MNCRMFPSVYLLTHLLMESIPEIPAGLIGMSSESYVLVRTSRKPACSFNPGLCHIELVNRHMVRPSTFGNSESIMPANLFNFERLSLPPSYPSSPSTSSLDSPSSPLASMEREVRMLNGDIAILSSPEEEMVAVLKILNANLFAFTAEAADSASRLISVHELYSPEGSGYVF